MIGALPFPTVIYMYQNQTPDLSRQVAINHNEPRQAPTGDDYISIKEALEIFTARGRSVTERTLQRYCEKLQLDGQKQITAEGEKWFVRRSSVHRRIDELDRFDQLRASRQVATSHDVSPVVAEENQIHLGDTSDRQGPTPQMSPPVASAQAGHTTASDMSRQDATGRDLSESGETSAPHAGGLSNIERELYERLLTHSEEQIAELMRDKEALKFDKDALLRQLEAKDKQIDRFFESERDTKTLAGRLQSLMSALWPKKAEEAGERYVPVHEALESGLDQREENGDGR